MTNKFLTIILITAILSIISCNFSKHKETEPNNIFARANIIEAGKTCTGTLETDRDIDCYSLTIEKEQIIRIELTGVKGVNHAFSVYRLSGDTGVLLKLVDDNRKSSPEDFANLFVTPGRYIISVHHGERDQKKGNPDTLYNLTITSSDALYEEHEPNDSRHAGVIEPGYPLTGYFSPARDRNNDNTENQFREEDWYSVEITADEANPVTVTVELSGVSGVDSVIELYDSGMNMIARSDAAVYGSGESIMDFGITFSGTCYIAVASKNFQYNNSQRYTISVSVNVHNSGTELEPNDSFEQANTFTGNSIQGRSNSVQDSDYYVSDQLFSGKHVRVELVNDEDADSTLTVYSSAKQKLFEVNGSGAGGVEVVPDLYVKGLVYLAVTLNTGNNPEAGYVLNLNELDSYNPVEIEPNNTKEEAGPISDIIKGYTTTKNDTDYYIITNDFRKNYRIEFRAPVNGVVKISTTDQSGYIIKTKELRKGESSSFNEIFEKRGYIIIETVTADFDNAYELIVEEIQ